MKKQTQSKLVFYWSKLPDGSRIHGPGTYKPPPVTDYSNNYNFSNIRFAEGCVVNLGSGNAIDAIDMNANDASNLAATRFGPASKNKVSDNTRNVANATNSHVSAINDEHRKKRRR